MKKILAVLFTCLSLGSTYSQTIQLSPEAQISIITCGPDPNELYAAFGHSAIRVYDPVNQLDEAFNYGIFDFNQPNFYLNFARGYLYYKLGVYSYPYFRDAYISYNRFVHEQVLNLTPEQKQKIVDYLIWNAAPENQTYRYDYFYNNCATKVRDVFAEVLKQEVEFDGSYIKTNYTIRQLTDLYLSPLPWGDLGIDICLGLPMDKKASPYEYMFLPDYIESGFTNASVMVNGKKEKLVSSTISVYEASPVQTSFSYYHPFLVFSVLALVIAWITWKDWKMQKVSVWLDVVIFSVFGWVGVLLMALWFLTDHQAAAYNYNLLWAFPLHILAPVLLWKKPDMMARYARITSLILIFTLLLWPILPQQLNTSLLPLILILGIRCLLRWDTRQPATSQ